MTDTTHTDLVSLAVQIGAVPRYLYKYRTITNVFDQILVNNQLWFSIPNNFNDPFDCQISVDTKNSRLEIENFIKQFLTTVKSDREIKNISNVIVNNPKEFDKIAIETINEYTNSLGICCFCENEDNHLLWSHYTDGHKGVCLKFDVQLDLDFFALPFKVIYQKDYPVYNLINNPPIKGDAKGVDELINKLLLTKSDLWSYEKEVRIIKNKSGLHSFKKHALVELIFGCKTSKAEINRIKNLALKNGHKHLTFKKAILKKAKYGLDFIKV